jgi:hypothetical protein
MRRRVPSEERAPLRARAACCLVVWVPFIPRVLTPPRLPRVAACRAEAPTTPCARLRCAPSEAGRENVLPHSGQTSVSVPRVLSLFAFFFLLPRALLLDVAALRALAIVSRFPSISRGSCQRDNIRLARGSSRHLDVPPATQRSSGSYGSRLPPFTDKPPM